MIRWGLGQTLDILYILQWKPGCKNYTLRVGLHKAHTVPYVLYLCGPLPLAVTRKALARGDISFFLPRVVLARIRDRCISARSVFNFDCVFGHAENRNLKYRSVIVFRSVVRVLYLKRQNNFRWAAKITFFTNYM